MKTLTPSSPPTLAQSGEEVQTVEARHHQVQEDDVHLVALAQGQGIDAVTGGEHDVALDFEGGAQEVADGVFVVDDEDGARAPVSCSASARAGAADASGGPRSWPVMLRHPESV